MSSILIKDMEMPKNCCHCDFTHCTRFGQKLCKFLNESTSIKRKLPDCPLSEIPTSHGRLIDADRLIRRLNGIEYIANTEGGRPTFAEALEEIAKAPTVIEAEQGDG